MRWWAVNFRGTVFTVQYHAAADERRCVDHPERHDQRDQGDSRCRGLLGEQGRRACSLARTWAAELKVRGIRVNVVSPGSIDTGSSAPYPLSFGSRSPPPSRSDGWEAARKSGAAALFLASSDASFITGANLVVDGGFSQI